MPFAHPTTCRIRAVIVDDELPARKLLALRLAAHPEVELVGEARNLQESIALCKDTLPELIFLDIHLRGEIGFDLLPHLVGSPRVIFATAFDHYAIRAVRVNALDYLLKPIHPRQLAEALARVTQLLPATPATPATPALLNDDDLVALQENSGMRMEPLSSVVLLQSESNYTRIYLSNGSSSFVRKSMVEWENTLPAQHFFRLSRSLMIRVVSIRSIQKVSPMLQLLVVNGIKKPLEIGRTAASRLRQRLSSLP